MIYVLSIIFVFCVIVFVHELGHYLAARSVGIRVEKFYLGFNFFGLGLKKKIGDTEYGIGAFPLGGYVKVSGIVDESMDMETTGADYEYLSKTSLQQIWFSSAGVLMNLLLSIVLFSMIFLKMGVSIPNPSPTVGYLIEDYPAMEAGLLEGDIIKAVNEFPVNSWSEMTEQIHNRPDETIFIEWERNGILNSDSLTTKSEKTLAGGEFIIRGMIGIAPVMGEPRPIGLVEAIQLGTGKTFDWLSITAQSLVVIMKGEASMKDIGGPVLIAKMAGDSAKSGIWALLGMMAIISINLAFINILPIPGLDGGHALISIIEGVSRRKLPGKVKMGIQQVGMFLLLGFIIIVIYNDITRLF